MIITGHWFEPDISTRHDAVLHLLGAHYELRVGGSIIRHGGVDEFSISDRMGAMPRRLSWADDGLFETSDNDTLDQWLGSSDHEGSSGLIIHHLEKSWAWAGFGIVLVVALVFAVFKWGLPAAAERIAGSLPVSVHQAVSRQTLTTLDKLLFSPTQAASAEREEVSRRFHSLALALPDTEFQFKLHFRQMDGIANAMALPGGDIIVTDALLALVEHPDELDAVLLHEMGHVVERHGMQHAIQASAISVIMGLAFGDLSGIGELGVGLPAFLLQSSYSRSRETEADAFAFERMGQLNMDPAHFARVITRLAGDGDAIGSGYFSSHPNSQERARQARKWSQQLGF